jgi:hypothetical protein
MNHRRPAAPGRSGDAGRPPAAARPVEDVPADVYVYRDTSGRTDDPAIAAPPGSAPPGSAPGSAEHDASYWYDLSGEDSAPVQEEARGPFEPLVSSSDPLAGTPAPGVAPATQASGTQASGTQAPRAERRVGRHAAPETAGGDGPEDSAVARARKLEQIKDFYLTAEAIGEQNVDKHFDQLLAQQRELISEYFKQPNAAKPDDGRSRPAANQVQAQAGTQAAAQAGPDPEDLGQAGRPPEPAPRVVIPAEQPRAW